NWLMPTPKVLCTPPTAATVPGLILPGKRLRSSASRPQYVQLPARSSSVPLSAPSIRCCLLEVCRNTESPCPPGKTPYAATCGNETLPSDVSSCATRTKFCNPTPSLLAG